MKIKYMKLKKYLKEVDERQKRALLRNQTLRKELDRLEARVKASGSEMVQKMAWYRREVRSVLSLQEGDSSAEGDTGEGGCHEQVPWAGRQAGISTRTGVPRGLYHPAAVFVGHHPSAILATGDLGTQQHPLQSTETCSAPHLPSPSPSLEGLSSESRGTDLESDASEEGAAGHEDVAASEEGSKQFTFSASDSKPASPKEEQQQGSIPGLKPHLRSWGTGKEASCKDSTELPVLVNTKEVMLSTPGVPGEAASLDRDSPAAEVPPLQPPSPPAVPEEPRAPEGCCPQAGSPREGGLEACEAGGLQQRGALSAPSGCRPPETALQAQGRAEDERQTRPIQQRDMDMLQPGSSNHGLFLGKHQQQLTQQAAETLERLLVSSREAQDSQALPVLREALPEESRDRSSVQSNESSCSSPSIPKDSGEIKQAKPAARLASAGEREVTSGCEDESKEESAVEKIPITGWAAGDTSPKAIGSQETPSESSSSLKERSPPVSRTETRKGSIPAIKSKAFWGESDDSSSELEAALCPQTHSSEADDFDDFYG
ncbi:centrosomal protein kizuna [Porphyrio hochstetteri]